MVCALRAYGYIHLRQSHMPFPHLNPGLFCVCLSTLQHFHHIRQFPELRCHPDSHRRGSTKGLMNANEGVVHRMNGDRMLLARLYQSRRARPKGFSMPCLLCMRLGVGKSSAILEILHVVRRVTYVSPANTWSNTTGGDRPQRGAGWTGGEWVPPHRRG